MIVGQYRRFAMTSGGEGLDSNIELIYRFTDECWNAGDLALVPELVADDCRHHDRVFPYMAAGPASLQQLIERVRRAFPDLRFTILDAVRENDEVKVHWKATATQAAEFLGIPAKNKSASITGTSIYRIERGKIVENRMKWDVMALMAQLLGVTSAGRETEHWRRTG
jgi:steroid delta-isomerase-like uncharacterized protein